MISLVQQYFSAAAARFPDKPAVCCEDDSLSFRAVEEFSNAFARALTAAGANLKNIQLLGTGLWDNPRVFASPNLQGGLYAAPDPAGFRAFAGTWCRSS